MSLWKQLNIYIGKSDRWHHQPLYAALIGLARKRGIAGATVTQAIAGFGKQTCLQTTQLWELSSDVPIVVTMIDREEALAEILPHVKEMVRDGLVTIQNVEVVHHAPISQC
jgi:PII-like signaling protein